MTKEVKIEKDNSVKITMIICLTLLGLMTMIGAAWGNIGIQTMFSIMGAIAVLILLSGVLRD